MSWSAEFSWTNPTQTITPTNTQVRMMNPVSLWATLAYPLTGIVWGGLASSTDYEFQVRLIRIVDGLITHFSPARSYEITTPVSVVPVVDGDGDVIFPTPGGGCTLEWELQESDDGTTWTTIDDGTDSSPPWTIDIDFGALDAEKLYRVRSREMCPGAGAWFYSDVFGPVCTTPPAVGAAPFDDAIGNLPGLCPPDIIVETVSDTTAIHAPSWGTVEVDGDGNIVLVSSTQGPVVFNVNTTATDNLTGDASLNIRVNLSTQPVGEVGLLQWAGLTVAVVPEGAGFKMRGKAHEEGAGITSVTDAAELDLNAWHDLTLTHDVAAGDLRLYADGTEVASSLGSVGERHDSGLYVLENAAASRSTNAAIWDRVLDPTEIPGYVAPLTVTINKGSGQADPTNGSSIVFDVVFSEAVAGFATGDITLSGTAGATTAIVSGTGPAYTVTVTGMTSAGTVVASIAAAVCTSVATGAPNEASTSTDNSVQFNGIAFVDTFNRANSGSIGAAWTETFGGGCEINSNHLRGNATPSTAHCNTAMGSNDHWVEIDCISGSSTQLAIDIRANQSVSNPTTYYRINFTTTQVVFRRNGATQIAIATHAGGVANKTLRVEIQGSTIRAYDNGSLLLSHTDGSPVTTGQYVGVRLDSTGDVIDEFRAGPL